MFFVISKLTWAVAAPVTLMLLAAVIGALLLWTRAARLGRSLVLVGAGGLFLTGVLPVGALLLRPLEDRFPPVPATLAPPTGIVVLGGSTDQEIALGRGRVTIANSAERLTEAVVLALRYPAARLVFSGGSADLGGSQDTEAADARRLWTAMGISDGRITTEDRSRNTDENVRFTRAMVNPRPGESWLLVSSAWHMPRAVALFRANGWDVRPDPVDYRTRGTGADFRPTLDVGGNWLKLEVAVHEWVGLAVYALTGRTRSLLPAP